MAIRKLSEAQYRQLADFRHTLRRFLRFSDTAAGQARLSSQQYHALLALRAAPAQPASIGFVAKSLLIKHNSAVELVDRLVKRRLVDRRESPKDRRKVDLTVTASGRRTLDRLVRVHRRELDRLATRLVPLSRLRDR